MFILCLPCVLGFNVLDWITPFGADSTGADSTILNLEDFIVSNLLLPIGCLIFILFCTTRYGWGWKNFVKEANQGKGLKVANWMRIYMAYVLPVIVFFLLVVGILSQFKIITL